MTVTCPAGHESATDDYCDTCGVAIAPAGASPPVVAPTAGSSQACANCGAPHEPGDAFCEVCGLDFATGELPQPPPPPEPAGESEAEPDGPEAEAEAQTPPPAPAPGDWYVVVEPDHDWFERNEAEGTTGSVGFPDDTSPWQLTLTGEEVLVGRRSEARTAQPDLELDDPGVSRRHAVLRRQIDGNWSITDEESTNGTWVDDAADPIEPGEPTVLTDGSTVHIGAFTRLTIRKA